MKPHEFTVCCVGLDQDEVDSLRLAGAGYCNTLEYEPNESLWALAGKIRTVIVAPNNPQCIPVMAFLKQHFPDMPLIIHADTAQYRFLVEMYLGCNGILFEKPFSRDNLLMALIKAAEQIKDHEPEKELIPEIFGTNQILTYQRWQKTQFSPVLLRGQPGTGKKSTVQLLADHLKTTLRHIDSQKPGCMAEGGMLDRQILWIDHLEFMSCEDRERLMHLMMILRSKEADESRCIIVATAESTKFVSKNDGVEMATIFGDLIFEFIPLESRWGEFRQICRQYFHAHNRSLGKKEPVDFDGSAYSDLSTHSWPNNLEELNGLIKNMCEHCNNFQVSGMFLKRMGWKSDGKRKSSENDRDQSLPKVR